MAFVSIVPRRVVLGLLAVLPMLAGCDWTRPKPKFSASDITGVDWGKDFALVDPAGTPRRLADYRGKVVMLFFGYTHCPDACPTTLAKMAQAVEALGADGRRVQGLFVTLDPKRDTPQVLAQYVPAFHPGFVGLSGDSRRIAATAKAFKVFYDLQPPNARGDYSVDHTTGIFVFDAQGRLRVFISGDIQVEAMVHDLRMLLDEASTAHAS